MFQIAKLVEAEQQMINTCSRNDHPVDQCKSLRQLLEAVSTRAPWQRNLLTVAMHPDPGPATKFRAADVFVLPSPPAGVPKVAQESAACDLPVILFGYYEAPSVVDGRNGYVVWSDRELERRLEELLQHPEKRKELGRRGAEMAKEWNWDMLAGRWEDKVRRLIVTSEGKGCP